MDSFMEEASEGSDATYKADTESYYSDLITPTEAMQSGDTNEAYVKRMREALEKALETAEADLPVMITPQIIIQIITITYVPATPTAGIRRFAI